MEIIRFIHTLERPKFTILYCSFHLKFIKTFELVMLWRFIHEILDIFSRFWLMFQFCVMWMLAILAVFVQIYKKFQVETDKITSKSLEIKPIKSFFLRYNIDKVHSMTKIQWTCLERNLQNDPNISPLTKFY